MSNVYIGYSFLFLDVNWCVKPGMFFLCAVKYNKTSFLHKFKSCNKEIESLLCKAKVAVKWQ